MSTSVMDQRLAVIENASLWLRTPFHQGARIKGARRSTAASSYWVCTLRPASEYVNE